MSWHETADFLEAAQRQGPRAHAVACLTGLHGLTVEAICKARVEDLSDEGRGRVLAVTILGGNARVPLRLTQRAAGAVDACVGPRCAGPLLLDDLGGPLTASDAMRIVNRVARSGGLGYRLSPRREE